MSLCSARYILLILVGALINGHCTEIRWVYQSLDDQPSSPPIQVDYLNWGSSGYETNNNINSVIIGSSNSNTISRHFEINIPHAYLIIQATFVENDNLSAGEGYQITLSTTPTLFSRYLQGSQETDCQSGELHSYTERISLPSVENSFDISLASFIEQHEFEPYRAISFRNFKIGIEPCEQSCAVCKPNIDLPNNGQPHTSVCLECPTNAQFSGESNICKCNEGYVEDYSLEYLQCIEGDIDDNTIPTYCKDELKTYSIHTRVNIVTQNNQSQYLANINSYQFFLVVPEACRPYLRQYVLLQDKVTSVYKKIGAKYVQSQIIGDQTIIAIPSDEIENLVYNEVAEDGKTTKVLNLAFQFKIGSVVSRLHHFQLTLETDTESEDILFSALNTDYQLNMNFISPVSFGNPPVFLKEYLFEIKRYFCSDVTCQFQRSTQGYLLHEQIIFRVAFKSSLNKQHLTLLDAIVFGDNQEFDVKSAITTLDDGQGYLTLALSQEYVKTPVDNGQSTNKAYLQATVSYLDNPDDPSSKVRFAQVVILFFALFTPQV